MAKDKIAKAFLALASPENKFTVSTIEDMQSRKYLKVGDIVDLNGYYTAGDGANHKRKIEETDDGSGVQLSNGLWANIVHNGEVNVSWFGAKGDGVADDTVAFEKMTHSFYWQFKYKVPKGRYVLTRPIKIQNACELAGDSTANTFLICKHEGDLLVVGYADGDTGRFTVESKVKDISLHCDVENNTGKALNIYGCGLRSEFERINITGSFGKGIYIIDSFDFLMKDIEVRGVKGLGLEIEERQVPFREISYIVMDRVMVLASNDNGVQTRIFGSDALMLNNCKFTEGSTNFIIEEVRSIFINNFYCDGFKNTGQSNVGIEVRSGRDISIDNLYTWNIGTGILVTGGENVKVGMVSMATDLPWSKVVSHSPSTKVYCLGENSSQNNVFGQTFSCYGLDRTYQQEVIEHYDVNGVLKANTSAYTDYFSFATTEKILGVEFTLKSENLQTAPVIGSEHYHKLIPSYSIWGNDGGINFNYGFENTGLLSTKDQNVVGILTVRKRVGTRIQTQTEKLVEQLNCSYCLEKMDVEVKNDFYKLKKNLHEYKQSLKVTDETVALQVLHEPKPSEKLIAFKTKYLG